MEQQSKNFLALIRSYMIRTEASLNQPDWEAILKLASSHNIVPLIYESARSLPAFKTASGELQSAFSETALYQAGLQITKTEEFFRLYSRFAAEGLYPVVLKGLVCRSLYPHPELRGSSDEDLWIFREKLPAVHRLLTMEGYILHPSAQTPESLQELTYSTPLLELDLHLDPFGTARASRQRMEEVFSVSPRDAVPVEIEGHTIFTLPPTEHYLYLFLHLYKHFSEGGVGIRQLLDLFLFEQAYSSQMDWDRIHSAILRLGTEGLYATVLMIGQHEFGFSLHAFLPASFPPDPDTLEALTEDLLESGCFGNSARYQQLSGTYVYASSGKNRFPGKKLLLLLFPPVRRLRVRYPFLKKRPWLLPAAWLIRLFRFAGETFLGDLSLAHKSADRGKRRLHLMEQLRLKKDSKTP